MPAIDIRTVRVAAADDKDYGLLLAAVEMGDAKYLGQRYDERGVKTIAVQVKPSGKRYVRNAGMAPEEMFAATTGMQMQEMERDARFWTTILQEYGGQWKENWFREAIQNSVDGGARNIDIEVRETSEGIYVSVEDDGRGMDRETLLKKFLAWGASGKEGVAGTTGGFGKAKELLLMPWLKWSVHSRDTIASGRNGYRTQPVDAKYRDGTKLAVVMAKDQCVEAVHASTFIDRCNLPGIRFTVNGEVVKANLRATKQVEGFDVGGKAILYENKAAGWSNRIYVRVNGILMFSDYIEWRVANALKRHLVLELKRPSTELLTVNRNGFSDEGLRDAVEAFKQEIASDLDDALRAKSTIKQEVFRGTGKFKVSSSEVAASLAANEGALKPKGKGVMTEQQVEKLVETIQKAAEEEEPAEDRQTIQRPSGEVVEAMVTGMPMLGPTHVETTIKQLAWTPDFYLSNEIEGFKIPKQFYPKHMTLRVKQLANFWAEIVRYVLIQLNCPEEYGVGFGFDSSFQAAYVSSGGENWLILNPVILPGFQNTIRRMSGDDPGESWNLSDPRQLDILYSLAVHECTHLVDGIGTHDRNFASAFTANAGICASGVKRVGAIRKAVMARIKAEPKPEKVKNHRWLIERGGDYPPGSYITEVEAPSAEEAILAYRKRTGARADLVAKFFDDEQLGTFWVPESQYHSQVIIPHRAFLAPTKTAAAEALGKFGYRTVLFSSHEVKDFPVFEVVIVGSVGGAMGEIPAAFMAAKNASDARDHYVYMNTSYDKARSFERAYGGEAKVVSRRVFSPEKAKKQEEEEFKLPANYTWNDFVHEVRPGEFVAAFHGVPGWSSSARWWFIENEDWSQKFIGRTAYPLQNRYSASRDQVDAELWDWTLGPTQIKMHKSKAAAKKDAALLIERLRDMEGFFKDAT